MFCHKNLGLYKASIQKDILAPIVQTLDRVAAVLGAMMTQQ